MPTDKFTLYSFKKGDLVLCLVPESGNEKVEGKIGTVKRDMTGGKYDSVAVEFGFRINGHNCDGCCEYGFGWYIDAHNLYNTGVNVCE